MLEENCEYFSCYFRVALMPMESVGSAILCQFPDVLCSALNEGVVGGKRKSLRSESMQLLPNESGLIKLTS